MPKIRQILQNYVKLDGLAQRGIEEAVVYRLVIEQVFRKFTSLERRVVYYYYIQGYSQREVGKILGISQSKVSIVTRRILDGFEKAFNGK